MAIRFYNGRVLRNHQFCDEELWVEQGRIISPQKTAKETIDLQGYLVTPGFIDLQVNGGFGVDFTTDINADAVPHVARHLPKSGVTAFLASIVSSTSAMYHKILPTIKLGRPDKSSAELLGIHLEGPFFHSKQVGAHSKDHVHMSLEGIDPAEFYGTLEGVRILTLAPEIPGL